MNRDVAVVEKIVSGGWGLFRYNKEVYFVNGVLPNEEIVFKENGKAKGINWAKLIDVREKSQDRVEPFCGYYGVCGGCNLQHLDKNRHSDLKKRIFKEEVYRTAHEVISIDNYYQSQFEESRFKARLKVNNQGKLGFIKKSTNEVLEINNCPLLLNKINHFLERWNREVNLLRDKIYEVFVLFNYESNQLYVHFDHAPKEELLSQIKKFPKVIFTWPGRQEESISQISVKGVKYWVSPCLFFQNNVHLWAKMIDCVDEKLSEHKTICDLYSGVGFFAPVAMKKSEEVFLVEASVASSKLAGKSFPQAKIFGMRVEKFRLPKAGALICDPPRSGISNKVKKEIVNNRYGEIVYVSCNSASFARDLRFFLDEGYRLEKLDILDLFPCTAHYETVALLKYNR